MPRRTTANTANTKSVDTNTDLPSKSSSGRGRKRTREPEDPATGSESAPIPAKKAKGPTTDPGPEPTIRRSARTTKPTTPAPTQKRKRQTRAEKEASKAAAEEAKRQKEEAAKEAEQRLARMDVDDAEIRARTAAATIKHLSNLQADSGEEFVGFDEQSSGSSDESSDVEDYETAYKAMQEKLKAMKQKMQGGGRKKRVGGGKKLTKGSGYASGLLPDSEPLAAKARSKKTTQRVVISAGGLEDDDADATNPFSTQGAVRSEVAKKAAPSGNLKRDISRQNTLVAIVPDDSEDREPVKKGSRFPLQASQPDKRTTARASKFLAATQITTKEKENAVGNMEALNKTKKRRLITTNNVRISDLPDFAQNQTWKKTFLPTLYAKFFASTEPFAQFAKGSDAFIALLQGIMKEVYPDVKYKVSANDAIHALAYNRINEKRSLIGSNAVDMLTKHISALKGEKAIRDWLLWASRGDGPLYFREPVARDAPLDTEDPRYEHPAGRLMTPFLINLTSSNLRAKSGSVWNGGKPIGLVALVMAAYERAVRLLLYPPTSKEPATEFSSSSCGSLVKDFVKTLGKIEESHWKAFLNACGSEKTSTEIKDEGYHANLSFMDRRRAALFDLPSPVKA